MRIAAGAAPGTLLVHPDAPPPEIEIIAYTKDELEERSIDDPADLDAFVGGDKTLWVNVVGLGDAAVLEELGRRFGLHCYDHLLRLIELVEVAREQCSDLMNTYLSSQSNRMNEVMKVLTIIATIFIPLGFVAGLYGMNFDPEASPWNMPELGWYFGYPVALLAMAGIALGLLFAFWRKGWFRS